MVMELLGQNLDTLMLLQKQKHFTLKTSLLLTLQILKRIQSLHEANFIHRDIKPENFLVGLKKKSSTIYMIDYGLTRKFYENKTHSHIPYREGKGITGTVKFASIYTHMGIEQSRRDDLETLGYILVYFVKGLLPWQGIKAKTKNEKYKLIMNRKTEFKPEMLCRGLPDEFRQYFEYVRGLAFTKRPDYSYLKGLFHKVMMKLDLINDSGFDWCTNVSLCLIIFII
jgi:serine/threonine protein kinase